MQSVCFTLCCQIDLTKGSLLRFAHDISHWSVQRGSNVLSPRRRHRQMAQQFRGSSVAPEHPDIKGSSGKIPDTPHEQWRHCDYQAHHQHASLHAELSCFQKDIVLLSKSCLGASIIQMVNCNKLCKACGYSHSTVGVSAGFGPDSPFSSAVILLSAFIKGCWLKVWKSEQD